MAPCRPPTLLALLWLAAAAAWLVPSGPHLTSAAAASPAHPRGPTHSPGAIPHLSKLPWCQPYVAHLPHEARNELRDALTMWQYVRRQSIELDWVIQRKENPPTDLEEQ